MSRYAKLDDLEPLVGQEIGVSDWIVVDQERIDLFARATEDHQWIHVDTERAAQGPFGSTIAHGYLSLSLLAPMSYSAFQFDDSKMGVNYGLNRVRFTAPVPAGSRLRARFRLLQYKPFEGGVQITCEATIEREGSARPVCIAETVTRRYR